MALAGIAILVVTGALVLYAVRVDHPVLYYYGASPEVPKGTAVAVLNPFRNRTDEATAESLILDLRTSRCEQIVRERLREDPTRICPVLHNNKTASLIWLDPMRSHGTYRRSRSLVYDLPESGARIVVYFGTDEVGWGVSTVSLIH